MRGKKITQMMWEELIITGINALDIEKIVEGIETGIDSQSNASDPLLESPITIPHPVDTPFKMSDGEIYYGNFRYIYVLLTLVFSYLICFAR